MNGRTSKKTEGAKLYKKNLTPNINHSNAQTWSMLNSTQNDITTILHKEEERERGVGGGASHNNCAHEQLVIFTSSYGRA